MLEQGTIVRSLTPEEEGVTEAMYDELTTASILHPPGVKNLRATLSPGRRDKWREAVLRFGYFLIIQL